MSYETLAKAVILTKGISFSDEAIELAISVDAKGQNMVYNAPKGYKSNTFRPQELILKGLDGYETCVSTVAARSTDAVLATIKNGKLHLSAPDCSEIFDVLPTPSFVKKPAYYSKKTSRGTPLTHLVSACGVDEMNIWPWHDCAISRFCTFCGVNKVNSTQENNTHFFKANGKKDRIAIDSWRASRNEFIEDLIEAIDIAITDDCYSEHLHLIMISGNLKNHELDTQAEIYSDIAKILNINFSKHFTEGIVAVTAPPRNIKALQKMKNSGISTVVFNLEAWMPQTFASECPGKNEIGRDLYLKMLDEAVKIFGKGNSWCNFVLGLDSISDTLAGCDELAARGITPSANVLHIDEGSSCKKEVPSPRNVAYFFRKLNEIYDNHSLRPYYCQKALRTSLSNETFAGRLNIGKEGDPINLLPI